MSSFPINHFHKSEQLRFSKAKQDFGKLERMVKTHLAFEKTELKISDVGTGLGYFMLESHRHGCETTCLELNKAAAMYAQEHHRLNVETGSIEEQTEFRNELFDVITMWGVIEHLAQPSKAVEECNRLLRPGGILCIQTPTEDGLFRKAGRLLYKVSLGTINFHVNHLYSLNGGHNICFSRRSIKALLEKHGFETLKIDGSTYGLNILLRRFNRTPVGILKILGTSTLYAAAQLLQMPNHMTVYARKKV